MALPAYRSLFRATRLAFQGDERMLTAARTQIRANFREKASLPVSDPTIPDAIQHAEAVAAFLRANVVQGKREGADGETYSTYNNTHIHPECGDWVEKKKKRKGLLTRFFDF